MSAALLASCKSAPPKKSTVSAADARLLIDRALPRTLADRRGWIEDIYENLTALTVEPSAENVCATAAVIQQESGFQVDPPVPNLGNIAIKEIENRAARLHLPVAMVRGVLALSSVGGRSYAERIRAAKTEKDLSDIYEDFISSVPLGRTLFEERNPIRTRGPMQVNVAFAAQFSAATAYPYPVKRSIGDELFTRRGSLYFGIAHLLDYRAPYDDFVYRFADYNAGQYASRNAAFQHALSLASGIALDTDGALLPHDVDASEPGKSELAARSLKGRLKLTDEAIHSQLAQGKLKSFEQTALYNLVFALADKKQGAPLPRARVPTINLTGPKLRRRLTTQWYAERVDQRFKRCLSAR